MMGKRKVFNCIYCVFLMMRKRKKISLYIYCARPVTGMHHAIASKNEYTHDVKAGLSLCWAHMGFFFALLMHSCSILMNRALRKSRSLLVT